MAHLLLALGLAPLPLLLLKELRINFALRHAHRDLPLRSELQRVAHQVEDHLLQSVLVLEDLLSADWTRLVEVQLDPLQVALDLQDLLDRLEHLRQREPLAVQRELSQLQFGQIEDVFDRLQKEFARRVRDVQHFLGLLVDCIVNSRVYGHNSVDRSPQIVSYGCEINGLVLLTYLLLLKLYHLGNILEKKKCLLVLLIMDLFQKLD